MKVKHSKIPHKVIVTEKGVVSTLPRVVAVGMILLITINVVTGA
jgi:hypothetical protein